MWKSVQPDPTDCLSVCTTTTRSRIVICLSVCLFAGSSEDNRLSWQAVENMAPGGCLFSGHLRTTPGLKSYLWIYPAVGLPSQSREHRGLANTTGHRKPSVCYWKIPKETHTHTNSAVFVAVVSGTGFYQVSALMYQRRSLSYTITKLWDQRLEAVVL